MKDEIKMSNLLLSDDWDSEIIHISYSGLNVLDVLYASGKYQSPYFRADNLYLGCEFSGMQNSKRVMGISDSGGIGIKSKTLPYFIWDVPDNWSLEEAATVPFAYAMVNMRIKM